MAGHNKWSQIKHKKAKEDSKKSKIYTKIIKEITMTAREHGGNPDLNPRLRLLLEKGKQANMPIENAIRAIKKGTGELPGAQYEEYTYEGYGPHGIAVIIDAITDNKNRTVAELRRLFSENGGTLGETGTVGWMFGKMGVINATSTEPIDEDDILNQLLSYDIDDVEIDNNSCTVYCSVKDLEDAKRAVENQNLKIESAAIEWIAKQSILTNQKGESLTDEQQSKVLEFLSKLQDHEDVENVYTNLG